jgi:hypothetical protein
MTVPTEINRRTTSEDENHEAANVDKIREILFGGQMRTYERHFARLEEQLAKETELLRHDVKKRYEALEEYVHAELDLLKQRLKAERTERTTSVQGLEHELRESVNAAAKRFAELDESVLEAAGEARARLLEQSKKLTEEIEEKHRTLTALVEREALALHRSKTDREALADLFTEVAMRLRDDFAIPESTAAAGQSA